MHCNMTHKSTAIHDDILGSRHLEGLPGLLTAKDAAKDAEDIQPENARSG